MAVGLFEDLSIFLQIGEIFGAITQLPKLIGQLTNLSLVQALILDRGALGSIPGKAGLSAEEFVDAHRARRASVGTV